MDKTVRSILSDFKDKGCADCVSKYCAENCGVVQNTETALDKIYKERIVKEFLDTLNDGRSFYLTGLLDKAKEYLKEGK